MVRKTQSRIFKITEKIRNALKHKKKVYLHKIKDYALLIDKIRPLLKTNLPLLPNSYTLTITWKERLNTNRDNPFHTTTGKVLRGRGKLLVLNPPCTYIINTKCQDNKLVVNTRAITNTTWSQTSFIEVGTKYSVNLFSDDANYKSNNGVALIIFLYLDVRKESLSSLCPSRTLVIYRSYQRPSHKILNRGWSLCRLKWSILNELWSRHKAIRLSR